MPRLYKVDAKGRLRAPLGARAQRYLFFRLSNPDTPKYKCAIAVGVSPKWATKRVSDWESNPFMKDAMGMILRKEQINPALAKRNEWERRQNLLVDRAADASQFGPAMAGMLTIAKANQWVSDTPEKPPVLLNIVLAWGGTNGVLPTPGVEGKVVASE